MEPTFKYGTKKAVNELAKELMSNEGCMQDYKRKLKLLFVCNINRMRSATAHKIYENDSRFELKSAGTDKTANTVLTDDILSWADSIVVMEKRHRNYIREHFPDIYKNKKIVCLYIPDNYDYMQAELIEILKNKIEDAYRRKLI